MSCGILQRKKVSSELNVIPPIVHDVLSSPGKPLDKATRAFFEPRFAHDFSSVRVHTDSRAGQSARAVNAHAYTLGSNLVFDRGQYAPHTQDGQRLLAHELAHVVQQRAVSPAGLTASIPIASHTAEYDADNAARQVLMGRPATLRVATPPQLARYARTEDVQTLSDDELASEQGMVQAWLTEHGAADPMFSENVAYLQQL
jgi:hypothetical protein